jgi:serine/threonine protein kinase
VTSASVAAKRCRSRPRRVERRVWRAAGHAATSRTLSSSVEALRSTSPVPCRIGRYRIEGVLGSGGTATVYLARDPALERSVALKVLRTDGAAHTADRLVREGRALARISHPNVIHVYEVGREEDLVYVAMERVEGVTLAAWLEQPHSQREILDAFAAAGRGLAAAHAAGVVHRDFKPDNVMLGGDGRVHVLDFGLARWIDDDTASCRVGGATTIAGTPAYMSPEQWLGEHVTMQSDQFSFCVSLWNALAGTHPFDISSRDGLTQAVVAGRLARRPRTIPRHLHAVLRRGLSRRACDRYPSLDAVVGAIAARPAWPWRLAMVLIAIALCRVLGREDR